MFLAHLRLPTMIRSYVLLLFALMNAMSMNKAVAQFQPRVKKPVKRTVSAHKSGRIGKSTVAPKPLMLPAHQMQFSRIGASEIWSGQRYRDSMLARQKVFWLGQEGLLYRGNPKDTMLMLIKLERPRSSYDSGRGSASLRQGVLYQDLNHDGSPEALVGFCWHWEGSGSRGNWVGINIIDVRGTPRLLLSATIENTESGWGTDEDNPDSDQEIFTTSGYERAVKLGGMDVRFMLMSDVYDGEDRQYINEIKSADPCVSVGRIAAANDVGETEEGRLTPLRPGRYRYQGGHLVWVGK